MCQTDRAKEQLRRRARSLRKTMNTKLLASLASIAVSLSAASGARAQESTQVVVVAQPPPAPPRIKPFGSAGQLTLDNLFGVNLVGTGSMGTLGTTGVFGFSSTTNELGGIKYTETSFSLRPSMDVF